MRHICKHQKISLSMFQEALDREDVVLARVEFGLDTSYIFTKPITTEVFRRDCDTLVRIA